jgi:hypothetical protein
MKRVVIIFGEPVPVPEVVGEPRSADRDAFSALVMAKIDTQIDQAYRILAP